MNKFFTILGHTDLKIGISGAKFDARTDFEVRFIVAPQKRHTGFSIRNCRKKTNLWHYFFSIPNHLKRGLPKFCTSTNCKKMRTNCGKTQNFRKNSRAIFANRLFSIPRSRLPHLHAQRSTGQSQHLFVHQL